MISAPGVFVPPQAAVRVRWDMNTDTPLPPDFPAGQNPPDGAMIDYYLQSAPSSPVTLEIKDSAGQTVRKYSSADKPEGIDPAVSTSRRMGESSRACQPRKVCIAGYGYALPERSWRGDRVSHFRAVPHNTVPQPTGPWAMPGPDTVVLTVDGKSYSDFCWSRWIPGLKRRWPACNNNSSCHTRFTSRC